MSSGCARVHRKPLYFFLASFRRVSARRARRPVVPPSFWCSRANSIGDLPAALAERVRAPGCFMAFAMKFATRLVPLALFNRGHLDRGLTFCHWFFLHVEPSKTTQQKPVASRDPNMETHGDYFERLRIALAIRPPDRRAVSSAIATACFCGRPEEISSLMFALTVSREPPFLRGIIRSSVRRASAGNPMAPLASSCYPRTVDRQCRHSRP